MCGFSLPPSQAGNAGGAKCARCGTDLAPGFDFCPTCGLDQRKAAPRPPTGALRVRQGPGGPKLEFSPMSAAASTGPVASPPAHPASAPAPAAPVGSPPAPLAPAPAAGPPPAVSAPVAAPVAADAPAVAPAAAAASSAYLVAIDREGREGSRHPLPATGLSIGREQGQLVFSSDRFLSALHARVEIAEAGRFVLVDAGSRNGVYLRITRPEPVFPGDMFLIGQHLLRLENIETPERERPPGADGTLIFGTPLDPPWARLVVLGRGGLSGDIAYLRTRQVVLGREDGDLRFPSDRFMSRRHARIALATEGQSMSVMLEDLDSVNGTYLRLRGRANIGPNDTFRVGDQILRVTVEP